jgi:hypothetical protein
MRENSHHIIIIKYYIIVGVCIIGIDAAVPLGSTYYILAKLKKMKKMNELFCTYRNVLEGWAVLDIFGGLAEALG